MKAASFDYVAPATIAAALEALAIGEDGRILAGGQSLTPMLNLRLAMPRLLVDIGGIAELRQVEDAPDQHVIGAMVTHAAIEDGRHGFADNGMLASIAQGVAYRAVRNRGTLCGSLAHADPAADWPSALTALGAVVRIAGRGGRRELAVAAFLRGAYTTALEPGEMITGVAVPKLSPEARWGYYKICRKAGEFADAIGAVVIDPPRRIARIAMGALDGAPVLLEALAAEVAEAGAAAASVRKVTEAVSAAAPDLDPIDLRLHAVAIRRALAQVVKL
ncbi:MAG: FAD binding domain-containing protein [Alphaproteobacteria bacterium]|nr:FAD binding domain-containing protein [Alphaproteobacteria bacterium]